MKTFFTLSFTLLLISFSYISSAQFQGQVYQYNDSIKVFAYGNEQTLAWCGGFDHPQFNIADLNNDGKKDLIIYERGIGVRTFLNISETGSPAVYKYAPEYETGFPLIENYLIMRDYNRDGVPDLFQGGASGFAAWRGYYNSSNQLNFTYYKDLYYTNTPGSTLPVNAYNNPGDIPAIVDVDNDGDMDFLAFYILGYRVWYYKNMQVEKGLPKDTIDIELKDECWGKFIQYYPLTHVLAAPCDDSGLRRAAPDAGAKKTHTGNAICLLDMSGHGDYDYLDGNISWNNLVYLENGRYLYGGSDSMVYQDTAWQSSGHSLDLSIFPAAFNVDIDQDGLTDILVSVNGQKGENYKCIVYYKNTGTPSHPAFTYQSDSFLIDKTIDLGTGAYPMLFDYNKDGKPDLFIGSDGYYQSDGTFKSRISYYLNTSTPGNPSFTLQTTNFLTLSTYGFAGAAPAVGDIDGDGKMDLIIGHTNGTLSYFKNMAASDTVQPIWQLQQLMLTDAKNDTINVQGSAAPFVYDMNKDGKPDLVIGEYHGQLQYYQNTNTTPGTASLTFQTNKLGNIKVDSNIYNAYSTPFIGKIDNTGVDYLLVGSSSGELYRYDGFQSGNTTIPYVKIDSNYSYIDSAFQYIYGGNYDGLRSAPAVADIDGDGKYEMVVGDTYGGVKLYKQVKNVTVNVASTNGETANIRLYPNPANNILYLSWDKSFALGDVQIDIINMAGQKLMTQSVPGSQTNVNFSISSLPDGLYICAFHSGVNKYYSRFTIVK